MTSLKQMKRTARGLLVTPGVLIAHTLVPLLPRSILIALSRRIGRLVGLLPLKRKRTALKNLDAVFGNTKTTEEKNTIIIIAFSTFCQTMLDLIWFSRNAESRIRKYVEFEKDASSNLLLNDQPALFVTAHLGSWELIGQTCALHGAEVASIAKPIKNNMINRLIIQYRECTGQNIIPKKGAMRALVSSLRQHGKAGFVLDQNAENNDGAIEITFLGLPMSVSAAPAALSYRTGTPIILVFCLPRPKGYYRIHIRKIITPPAFDKTRNTKDVVQDITQDIVNTLSDQITDTPESWLWSHRYWRRRKGNCYPAHYPTY